MPGTYNARFAPQGTCPKAWIATVNGEALRTSAGGVRRYGSEKAALSAARQESRLLSSDAGDPDMGAEL